ncbi:glucose 1-dehydrogenase [Terrarubrum flagellatum]|uniref:SDR family NAD(P)-dependent oxidoreductase n=1 Tax=Terrirubrum flagellatum TaxID=2895980 RepID=UPI0031451222
MRLQGKTALITGGNSGIGLETARVFVAEGAKVIITGRNRETLDAAVKELGANALAIAVDAADGEGLAKALEPAVARFGKLDIVFANAGIGGATPLGQTTREAFDAIISINLTGVFFTVQAAAPHLKDGGSVILNSSVHSTLGAPGWAAYAASKAGVRAMGRVLASELATRNIRVNVLTPGGTQTPIWTKVAPAPGAAEAIEQRISRGIPFGRFGKPDELAKAALFLASDDSVYMTGAELVIDGGATGAPSGSPIYR